MKVPVYSASTVTENAAPVVQQNPNVSSAAFGAPIAQGIANAGNMFQQMADDADNLRVQEAYNQLRERQLDLEIGPKDGFANIRGREVMAPRENGKSLSDDYLERFDTVGREIESGLANDRQRQKFRQKYADSAASFRAGLVKHETREISEYGKAQANAVDSLATQFVLKGWNDPEVVNKGIADITDVWRAQGLREGMPADALKVLISERVSRVHFGVIASALESQNLGYASEYLKQYSGDMQAEHVLKVQGLITKEMENAEAVTVAGKVVHTMRSAIDPTDYDRLKTLVATQESGNRERDANGNLITSSKGAKGKMQVLDGTKLDPGYGVKPAQDDSDAERTRVGDDYLKAMLKQYGGDVSKALAAYNAGPGALDQAIEKAKKSVELNKNDPSVKAYSYLDFLPKETQDYVAKIGTQYASGIGGKRATLEDVQNQVRAEMAGKPAHQVKLAVDHATQLFETNQKAKKQREDDNYSEAMKYVDLYEGDLTKLPASVRMNLRGDQLDNLQNYAAKRAKGIEPATDWSVYYDLRRDPEVLKKTNLIAFRHVLGESEFKALVNEQQDLRSGKAESVTATRSPTQILNAFLAESGIDPTPKPSSSADSDAVKVGRAMRAQQSAISAAEQANGRKLTPQEVEEETARLFTKVDVKGFIFGTNVKPLFDVRPGDKVVVPAAERAQIIAALQATKRPVNETSILELYSRKNNLPR